MAKLTFEEWMKQVDEACIKKCGLSAYDLPDSPFRDWYDDGVSPVGAASRAVKNAKE